MTAPTIGMRPWAIPVPRPAKASLAALLALTLPPGLIPGNVASVIQGAALLLALVAWIVELAATGNSVRGGAPIALLVAFFVWSLVTALWAADLVAARRSLVQYAIFLVLLVLLVNYVRDRAAVDRVMDVLALAGWVYVVASLASLIAHGYSSGSRLQVLDVNDNQLGNMLIVLLPGVIWRARRLADRSKWHLLPGHLYVVASLAIIALSGSRGSLVGFAAMTVMFLLFRSTRRWARTALLAALGFLLVTPLVYGTATARLSSTSGEASRWLLWSAGLTVVADRPWSGAGVGNGSHVMPAVINASTDANHFIDGRTTYPAHDPLIEVGTDSGIPGMVLYAGVIGSAAAMFVVRWRRAGASRDHAALAYCAAAGCGSVAFLLVWAKSGGESSHISTLILLLLWLMPVRISFATSDEQP